MVGNALNLANSTSSSNYVDLPDNLMSGVTDLTIAVWVRVRTDRNWQRIFDFGASTTVNMFLTSHASMTGVNAVRFAITMNGNTNEQVLTGAGVLPVGTWTHVAVVLGSTGGILYINGVSAATNTNLLLRPSMLGTLNNNWIGRSRVPRPVLRRRAGRIPDLQPGAVGGGDHHGVQPAVTRPGSSVLDV